MILINNLKFSLDTDFENLEEILPSMLKIDSKNILKASLYRKSIDARKKNDVHFCCSVIIEAKDQKYILKKVKNAQEFKIPEYEWKSAKRLPENRPIIIGFGPAGMFAALTLSRAGLKPIVFERGADVDSRTKAVRDFFEGKALDPENNVQFGEGGAGTFSDGKLNTGIKNPRCRTVLEELYNHGADKDILIDAKPHIGTDILVDVVKNIRNEIIALGGEIHFNTKFTDIETEKDNIKYVVCGEKKIPCNELIIATGHSARDTFKMLLERKVDMMKKPFSVGVRIEHLRSDIDKALYGEFAASKYIGAADYKLSTHLKNGRGVYTFCMCPGGEVINASSEIGTIAVNGMSKSQRKAENSNSAVLVNVEPNDFKSDNVLAGCEFQRKIEQSAFRVANGAVPITTVAAFLKGSEFKISKVKPSVKPKFAFADFDLIFPEFVCESLREGIKIFGTKILGFDDDSAILTAPETRSSSPVRILRGENLQSNSIKGLFPCGEGAGYAGGIVSAAVDGITVAEKIIELYS